MAVSQSGSTAPAQYQNPSPYPAPHSQGQQSPPLIVVVIVVVVVVIHVNNAGVGTANVANFSQVIAITNAFSNPDGYTYAYDFVRGSQRGVNLNLQQGIFTVPVLNNNKTNSFSYPIIQHDPFR